MAMAIIVRNHGDFVIRDMSQPDGHFLRVFSWWWVDARYSQERVWADFGLKVGRYDLIRDRWVCFEPGVGLNCYRMVQWIRLHIYYWRFRSPQ